MSHEAACDVVLTREQIQKPAGWAVEAATGEKL